jgi:hypothetical protein
MTRKPPEEAEYVSTDALSEDAARSFRQNVAREQAESQPEPAKKGAPRPGMPAEADFVTPRQNQGTRQNQGKAKR